MIPEKKIDNYANRKRKLIKQTIMVTLGYLIVLIAIISAKFTGLTSIETWQIIFCSTLAIGGMLLFIVFILPVKKLSNSTANIIYVSQYILWLILYFFFVYWLKEIRIASLLFAVMALVFVISNSTFAQSLALTLGATLITLAASFIAIHISGQPGNFGHELFFILCFLPSALYLSYMAGEFKKQRQELNLSRKNAEKARDALWSEMELARKIQSVLLPGNPEIEGYTIAAYMEPADEVGGDYYDIINVKGKDWIIIGDVSGHGVTAGLIMMMVQTSIHLALEQLPSTPPSELLVSINKIISQNIRHLNEDKYMTITVIAAMDEGKFFFSGLHQDIMVYRAEDSRVDLIETRGMWIGIMDDINGMLNNDHFSLMPGDAILIYTDGITEASKRTESGQNSSGEMFGDNRLMELFKQHGHKPVEEIRKTIIAGLEGYTYEDDITLLILKRT